MCMKRSRVPTKNSLEYTSESDLGAGLLAQVGKVEVDGREWNDENGVSRGGIIRGRGERGCFLC